MSVLSLIFLAALSTLFIIKAFLFAALSYQVSLLGHALFVFVGILIGVVVSGKADVFIHELKHSIVSNLAGNKAKGMKVDKETGHFEYTFTKQTSHLNAFISLAPYTFPIFSLAFLPLAILMFSKDPVIARYMMSCALGIDLLQSAEDVGPYQTDFSELRGGFFVGIIYVVCFNFILTCLVTIAIVFGYPAYQDFGYWLISYASASLVELRNN